MDFASPGTQDSRLESAAASGGQGGPSPQGELGEERLSPHQRQGGSSPHGERRKVESSTHEGQ